MKYFLKLIKYWIQVIYLIAMLTSLLSIVINNIITNINGSFLIAFLRIHLGIIVFLIKIIANDLI